MSFETVHIPLNTMAITPHVHSGAPLPQQGYEQDATRPIEQAIGQELRVWGMSPLELHDAYWMAHGIQCVRRGQSQTTSRSADLLLLLEPDQLVLLDVQSLINRVLWHGASLTRICVCTSTRQYREAAVLDGEGFVQRIERHYNTLHGSSQRVQVTPVRKLAEQWMHARTYKSWRDIMAERSERLLIDRVQLRGATYRNDDPQQQRSYLTHLVEQWDDPSIAIDGIHAVAPGVWAARGDRPSHQCTFIGPIWLGFDALARRDLPLVIGPAYLPDGPESSGNARVRSPRDMERPTLPERANRRDRFELYPTVKRAFDVAVSATVLFTLWPVMLLVALAILWDDGFPVLFRHRRQSRHGRVFDCLKFRTMRRNAERLAPELQAKNRCDGPQVFIEDDPRVTRVGRILRALHIDELPQFWNVLKGDMSMVGPRPSPDAENRICPAWRELRLSVRPGITGLWQIKRTRNPGRDFQEWIRYDIEYVRNASVLTDLRICVQTAMMILLRRRN